MTTSPSDDSWRSRYEEHEKHSRHVRAAPGNIIAAQQMHVLDGSPRLIGPTRDPERIRAELTTWLMGGRVSDLPREHPRWAWVLPTPVMDGIGSFPLLLQELETLLAWERSR